MITTVIVYLFAIFFCTLMAKYAKNSGKKVYIVLLIVAATLIAGCRAISVGNDTAGYYQMFASRGSWGFIREFAFRIYIQVTMAIFQNANICLLFSSLLTNLLFIIGLWKIRNRFDFEKTVFAYMAIIYFLTMSAVRQWLSLSIIMFAMSYLFEEKYFKYFISTIIATLLHYTTICALSYIFIMHFAKHRRSKTIKDFGIRMAFVAGILAAVFIVVPLAITEYTTVVSKLSVMNRGGLLMVVFRFIIAIFFALHIHNCKVLQGGQKMDALTTEIDTIKFVEYSYILWALISALGVVFLNIARIGWAFLLSQGLMYGSCTKGRNQMTRITELLLLVLFVYSVYAIFATGGNSLVPYKTFWT